jgi:hypothetical protein
MRQLQRHDADTSTWRRNTASRHRVRSAVTEGILRLRFGRAPREACRATRTTLRPALSCEKLLDYLQTRLSDDVDRVLGLTSSISLPPKPRLSTGASWGSHDRRPHVRPLFPRANAGSASARMPEHGSGRSQCTRSVTPGARACPTPGCLMHDAEGSVLTVDSERDLCQRCRKHLTRSDRLSATREQPPWGV